MLFPRGLSGPCINRAICSSIWNAIPKIRGQKVHSLEQRACCTLPEVIFCSAIQNGIPKKREQKKLLASSVRQAPSTEETIGETAIRQFPDLCVYYITRILKKSTTAI